jgi:hypothetical protein
MYDVATRFDAQIHRVYYVDAVRGLKIVAISPGRHLSPYSVRRGPRRTPPGAIPR